MAQPSPTEKSIFLAAVEIESDADRAAFVKQACAGNPQLHGEVDALLCAHAKPQPLLDVPPAPGQTIDQPITEQAGTMIGPYKLLEQIGEGGFGVVFMAEQTEPVRRKVALKILKPGMDTRQVVARFEAERQALALMDHPNIAKVFDGGTTGANSKSESRNPKQTRSTKSELPNQEGRDGSNIGASDFGFVSDFDIRDSDFRCGRPYFVMELVKGVPITDFCDQHHLTPRQRLELFIPVCQAVQHAHQKGLIHRDLKPSNVMVTVVDDKAVPKVIDFGIAKAMSEAGNGLRLTDKTLFTAFAQMIGTPLYMSPEQAGQSVDIDTRSDIYALGVLLYELLTGTTPFDKERLKSATYDEMRRIIREEEPARPSTRLSTLGQAADTVSTSRRSDPKRLSQLVRGELDWIVMKCLEKDRNRRYETANALAQDLQRYLADEPVVACPPSSLYRFRKFVRRHQGAFLTASAATLVLLLALAGLVVSNILITEEKNRVVAEQKTGKHRLYEAKLAEAKASRWSGRVGQRFDSLQALREAAEIARELELDESHRLILRNEAIACMCLTDLQPLRRWDTTGKSPWLACDGELRRYAQTDGQGNVIVRSMEDDRVLVQLTGVSGPGQIGWVGLSRDGRFLPVRHEQSPHTRLSIWDLDRRDVALRVPGGCFCDFSLDGRWVAVSRYDGSVGVYDLSTGKMERQLGAGRAVRPHPDTVCFFDAQGAKLAVFHLHDPEVRIWDLGSNGPLKTLACPDPVFALAWHPGGQLLAVGDTQMRIRLWDLETDRPQKVLEGHDLTVTGLSFDRAGDLLASTSWDGTTCLWDPRVGRPLIRIPGSQMAQFSTDGRRLAVGSPTGRALLDLNPGQPYRSHHHGSGFGNQVVSSVGPDGRLLVTASGDGVRIADLVTGKNIGRLEIGTTYTVHFDPAGEYLFTGGKAGLHSWRLAPSEKQEVVRVGPPKAVCRGNAHAAPSHDGKTLLVSDRWQHAVVLDTATLAVKARLSTPVQMFSPSVSPDGRWVAIGTFGQDLVRIWDMQSGQLVHQFANPGFGGSRAAFSPDGHRLVVSGGREYLCLEVGSWQEHWRRRCGIGAGITPPIAFAPDGGVLAVASTPRDVTLLEPASGREYCTLAAPTPQFIHQLCFSPDGSQLVASNDRSQAIPVWDLRRIRGELAALGLDWDQRPYPPAAATQAEPVRIDVDYGGLREVFLAQEHIARGLANARAKKWREAIAAYSKGIALKPDDALAQNNLAWHLVTCPDPKLHDPERGVELAKKAVALDPQPNHWNTLGAAHYRAGHFLEALTALDKAMARRNGGDSFDWFFVAMSHWRLGKKDEARKWYDQAAAWMEKHQPENEELRRFRAEAEELIGVKEKKD